MAISLATLFLLLLAKPPQACAQQIAHEIAWTRSDSIVFLDRDITNFQLFALLVNRDAAPAPFVPPTPSLAHALTRWKESVLPALNPVGSTDEMQQGEGFTAVANFYEAAFLWLSTGDAGYMDAIERCLMGSLPATMFYSTDIVERSVAAAAVMDASQLVYATDSVGLYVNLYINTFAHIVTPRGQDYMVDIITSMPWEGMTKLRLRSPGKHTVEATLRLRIPEWQETPLPIYVNGIEYDYNIQRGYAIITRSWQADDEVYIPFNVVPRRVVENGRTMWRGGPIVYCLNDSLQCNARADIQYCGEDPETRHPIYALSSTTPGDTTKHVLKPYFDLPPEKRNIWQSNQSR